MSVPHDLFRTICSARSVPHDLFRTICSARAIGHDRFVAETIETPPCISNGPNEPVVAKKSLPFVSYAT
jgi:hypothetical protein